MKKNKTIERKRCEREKRQKERRWTERKKSEETEEKQGKTDDFLSNRLKMGSLFFFSTQ